MSSSDVQNHKKSLFLNYDKPLIIHDYYNGKDNDSAYISFNGINPSDEYCFEMKNINEAEKLFDFLTKRTPISFYRPICCPRNK
jgi:hypothetical protein